MSPQIPISANPPLHGLHLRRILLHSLKNTASAIKKKKMDASSATEVHGRLLICSKKECDSAGVKMRLNCKIQEITKKSRFIVRTNSGVIESESLVVATGGLSYPNLGATDIGHRIAAQFGLRIVPPKPALVPFTFSRGDREKFGELSGISLEAVIKCGGHEFRGEMLFTHKGLSGPAILQASSYWEHGEEILVNLLPGIDARSMFLSNRQSRVEMKKSA